MVVDSMPSSTKSPLGTVPHGWRLVRTSDITTKIGSGATPSGGAANYLLRRTKYALIRSQNVFDRYFDTDGLAFISEAQASELMGAAVSDGDVLLNITGDGITFGRACIAPRPVLPACVNQHVSIIRANKNICEPGYLLSYLTHPSIKRYIESFNAGGSRRAITKGHIESFVIPLPPLTEQRAIAHILGTLDAKIELNRRMNETLEEMARAVFKSWFVDFDPVHAKAEGRKPAGMAPETAKLFPSEFVSSELGDIPRGWRIVPLLQLADLLSGGTPKTSTSEYWNGNIKWASAKDVSQCGSFFLLDTERTITDAGLQRSATKLIPAGSVVVVARGATCGRFTVLAETMAMNQTCYALTARNENSKWFLRFLLERLLVELVAQAHGSVFDTITTSTFERARLRVPNAEVLTRFEAIVSPLMLRIRELHYESRTLASLRDSFLPKLLSGELRIENPDAFLKEHIP